jgi:hypothetical protein
MRTLLKAILLITLFAFANANAQTLNWAHNWGNSSWDEGWGVTTDFDGNVYVTGFIDNALSFSTVKYNPYGRLLWDREYSSQYYYTEGRSISSARISPSQTIISVAGIYAISNNSDICRTICYDQDGSELWTQTFSLGDRAVPTQVVCDNTGRTYVCGSAISGNLDDYFVIAYDIDGGLAWWHNWDGGYGTDWALGIAISGGNVYVTGVSENKSGTYDVVTLAYDYNGNPIWVSPRYSLGVNNPNSVDVNKPIAADWFTGVYVCYGWLNGQFLVMKYNADHGNIVWCHNEYPGIARSIRLFSRRIDDGDTWLHTNDIFVTGSSTEQANRDYLTAMYYDDGTIVWHSTNSGGQQLCQAFDLCLDNNENTYVTGYIYNSTENGEDFLTIKYNTSGVQQWQSKYRFGDNSVNRGHGIVTDNYGNIDVVGIGCPSPSDYDFGTLQYKQDEKSNPVVMGNNVNSPVPKEFALNQNYPNPFNPTTKIKYAVPRDGSVCIKVYDIMGRVVATLVNEYKSVGYYTIQFDGSKYASGMYFYRITAGAFMDVKKMMLVK